MLKNFDGDILLEGISFDKEDKDKKHMKKYKVSIKNLNHRKMTVVLGMKSENNIEV